MSDLETRLHAAKNRAQHNGYTWDVADVMDAIAPLVGAARKVCENTSDVKVNGVIQRGWMAVPEDALLALAKEVDGE